MPELFARPLGPDGEPVGPMRRLGTAQKIMIEPEKIMIEPNPLLPEPIPTKPTNWPLPGLRPARFMSEYTFTIKPGDEAHVMSLFHGGPTWLWKVRLAWGRCAAPPISRGTAWQTGAFATFHRQTIPRAARRNGWRSAEEIAALIRAAARPQYYRNRLARDYPPPAEPCQECIAMADPWRRLLRIAAECKISRDDLLRDHRDLTTYDIIRSRYPGAR